MQLQNTEHCDYDCKMYLHMHKDKTVMWKNKNRHDSMVKDSVDLDKSNDWKK